MGKYILRRLLHVIPVVIGISIIVFAMLRFIPGDACRRIHGVKAKPEVIETCRIKFNFDKPIWVQYPLYLQKIFAGDLGTSYIYRRPALELIRNRFPPTLLISAIGIVLSILISIPVGLLATLKRDTWVDHSIRIASTFALSVPSFVIAIVFMLSLSIHLKLFPLSGYGQGLFENLKHAFLPGLTLAVTLSMLLTRNLRSSLLDVLRSHYIRTARAKGLANHLVFLRHAIPNALISYISLLGLNAVFVIGGTVIVEQVFAIPGLGALMITSIGNRDYEIVQSITLIFALLVELVNLIVDLSYPFIDPRIRYD